MVAELRNVTVVWHVKFNNRILSRTKKAYYELHGSKWSHCEDSVAMPMMGRRWPKLPEVGAANPRPRPLRKKACVRPPPCPARAAWAVLSPSSPYPTEDWLFPFDRSLPALVFLTPEAPEKIWV